MRLQCYRVMCVRIQLKPVWKTVASQHNSLLLRFFCCEYNRLVLHDLYCLLGFQVKLEVVALAGQFLNALEYAT